MLCASPTPSLSKSKDHQNTLLHSWIAASTIIPSFPSIFCMKRFALSTLSLYLVLQPLMASAAFDTPKDLSVALRSAATPKTFSGTLHVETTEGTFITAWMSGTQTGKSMKEGTLDMKVTVDIAMPKSSTTARAKMNVRVVNQTLYTQLLSLDGVRDDVFSTFKISGMMKKWLKMGLDDSSALFSQEELFEENAELANSLFTMTSAESAQGTTYTLALKPNDTKGESNTILGMYGSDSAMDAHITVSTDKNDVFQKGTVTFTMTNAAGKATFDIQSQKIASPAAVVVPDATVDMDTLFGSVGSLLHSSFTLSEEDEGRPLPPDTQWIGQPASSSSSSLSFFSHDTEGTTSSASSFEDMTWWTDQASSLTYDRPSRRTIMQQYQLQEKGRIEQLSASSVSSSSYAPVGDYLPTLPLDGYGIGDVNAPVTVVEFVDYACPSCALFDHDTMSTLYARYIKAGQVRWVFRNLPISYHPAANVAAMAVECSRDQSEEYAYTLSALYLATTWGKGELTQDDVYAGIQAMDGIDTEKMYVCMDTNAKQSIIDRDTADADAGGINGVPSFWVLGQNGKAELIQGVLDFAGFKKVLDNMLK